MPGAAHNGLEPERFAALWAGCDTINSNDAEAMTKFRMLRRMVGAENLRIIDVMGRADVMAALDAQLQPLREEEGQQLKEAFGKIAELAETLMQERETTAELRDALASVAFAAASTAMPAPPRVSDSGLVNGGLVAAVLIVAVALMIAAVFQPVTP
jgi:hypothetical protein